MKTPFSLLLAILLCISVSDQSPQKMSYQCVVRNSSGALVSNQAVGVRISLLQGSATGTLVYQETFSPNPQTNANGLLSIEIGTGTPVSGSFSSINWAGGPYFLKTETDPAGGTTYTITATSQLLSVPYALYAKTVKSGDNWGSQVVMADATLSGNGTTSTPLKAADSGITSAKIADATIVAADLANNAVTTDKINAGAVTGAKIAQAGATSG